MIQAAVALAATLLVLGLGMALAWLVGSPPGTTAYCVRDVLLTSQAQAGSTGAPVLQRGQQVTIFATEGSFAMVRDLQGRVGYAQLVRLAPQRPPALPESAFVDCVPEGQARDASACEARAEAQWDSCGSICEHGRDAQCAPLCRRRYKVCLASCRGETVQPEPAVGD